MNQQVDDLFSENNIYVCEWVIVDFEVEIDNVKAQILKTLNYSYHHDLESSKYASSLGIIGFLLATDVIRNTNESIPLKFKDKNIFCHNIWIYKEDSLIGKYQFSELKKEWYPYLLDDSWQDSHPDLMTIPLQKTL